MATAPSGEVSFTKELKSRREAVFLGALILHAEKLEEGLSEADAQFIMYLWGQTVKDLPGVETPEDDKQNISILASALRTGIALTTEEIDKGLLTLRQYICTDEGTLPNESLIYHLVQESDRQAAVSVATRIIEMSKQRDLKLL